MIKKILRYLLLGILGLLILLSIIPYLVPIGTQSLPEDFKPYPESSFLKTQEGIRMHYRIFEPQKPKKGNVALIHGFSGSTFSWRKNISSLTEQGYRVLALDLPAFGYSDKKSGINHSPSQRAKLAWEVVRNMEDKEKDTWAIVGHSMGGGVVMAMALLEPEKTKKVILVDGGYFSNPRTTSSWFRNVLLSYPPLKRWIEVIAFYNYYTEDYFKTLLSSAYSQDADEEAVKGYLAPFLLDGTTNAIVESAVNNQDDSPLDYDGIKTPIYLIWGGKDTWVPLERGKAISEKYNAPLKLIQDTGHNPMETRTEEFNKILLDFLGD